MIEVFQVDLSAAMLQLGIDTMPLHPTLLMSDDSDMLFAADPREGTARYFVLNESGIPSPERVGVLGPEEPDLPDSLIADPVGLSAAQVAAARQASDLSSIYMIEVPEGRLANMLFNLSGADILDPAGSIWTDDSPNHPRWGKAQRHQL